ncbi:N-acetyllactosaminide beta-1,6-N-acetylglucosaminyl-transferase-like [Babylonia areolata]|uniref:N-acetyllactosaminide beta-1,6-N-acetylglucosaminyl-transferase-like n=1 Tax=Babylonia areolata TaxID=304850 RepID=UPI003FD3AE1A
MLTPVCCHRLWLYRTGRLVLLTLSLTFLFLYLFASIYTEPVIYVLEQGFPLVPLEHTRDPQSLLAIHVHPFTAWAVTQMWGSAHHHRILHYDQCKKLISGDPPALRDAHRFMATAFPLVRNDHTYIRDTYNCTRFVQERGYILDASEKEKEFPIAFSVVFYKDIEQMERLLRAIYRPHNLYCLHLDKKSPPSTWRAVRGVTSCLPNVFLSSRAVSVEWGEFSVLEPELICMQDLWHNKTWRYFINLTGQEFPLKTNLQLVEILSAFNGSNDVDGTTNSRYRCRWYNNFVAPHHIKPLKGNLHVAASRPFVDFLLHSHVAADFLDWVRNTEVPDETFFSSLNHNPHLHAPGSFLGPPDTDAKFKPYLSRFKNWGDNWKDVEDRLNFCWPCHGKRVRSICIFGVGDLPSLTSRKELFANKFHADFQPLTVDCLEQWLWNMTMAEYSGIVRFNVSFYRQLSSVHNHVVNPNYG